MYDEIELSQYKADVSANYSYAHIQYVCMYVCMYVYEICIRCYGGGIVLCVIEQIFAYEVNPHLNYAYNVGMHILTCMYVCTYLNLLVTKAPYLHFL